MIFCLNFKRQTTTMYTPGIPTLRWPGVILVADTHAPCSTKREEIKIDTILAIWEVSSHIFYAMLS